jgi:hypothetical protein
MRGRFRSAIASLAVLMSTTAKAADLATIARSLAKEPTFRASTRGLGKGTFAALAIDRVPANVHPVAGVNFPTAETGRPPTHVEFVLGHRC